MDTETAHRLSNATSEFYATNAESFSSTRERPWDGWDTVLEHAAPGIECAANEGRPFRVLDIGCGNMRFERMLAGAFPGQEFGLHAVDNCPAFACDFAQGGTVRRQRLDVIGCLERDALAERLDVSACDLVVAFGFMHHVPVHEWRVALLTDMVGRAAPGGIVAATFWQFAKNEKLRRKAERATEAGCARLDVALRTEDGDYLLGWQGDTSRFRYCHSFSDEEILRMEQLAEACGATVLPSYSADGPDGRSNRYLVVRKQGRFVAASGCVGGRSPSARSAHGCPESMRGAARPLSHHTASGSRATSTR